MPDESHNTTVPAAAATPASNQNLIIGLVLGAAVLLLLFLVVDRTKGGQSSSTNSELRAELELLKKSLSDEYTQQGLGNLGNGIGVNPEALASQISLEANALAGLISEISTTIRSKDLALQSAEDTRQALNKRINDLQLQLNSLSASASDSIALRQKLESAETLLQAANRTIDDLRKRLAEAPDANAIANLQSENARLREELQKLRDQYNLVEPELRRLREENQKLRAQLDRSTLFVENADALPAIAQRLFRELERLEGVGPSALQTQYERITSTLNARVLRSVNFNTGSSSLTNDKIASIRNDLAASPADAFLLIVGYASTTGDFDTNRTLSSKRATAVASQVNLGKQAGQDVRAVFLNETQRFSRTQAPANQICEIWEIRP